MNEQDQAINESGLSSATRTSTPLYDIPAGNIEKMNVSFLTPEREQTLNDAIQLTENLQKSLEDRYKNPNWFRIAAGFLKPQLGGFAASLGTAAQEYGQQVENQRAMAPTIEKMKADIAIKKNQLATARQVADIQQNPGGPNGTFSPIQQGMVAALQNKDYGEAAQNAQSAQTNNIVASIAAGKSYYDLVQAYGRGVVDNFYKNQFKQSFPNLPIASDVPAHLLPQIPGTTPTQGTQGAGATAQPSSMAHTPGISDASMMNLNTPDGIPREVKMNRINDKQKAVEANIDKYANLSYNAGNVVNTLTHLYSAASDPSLKDAFGVFEQNWATKLGSNVLENLSPMGVGNLFGNARDAATLAMLNGKDKDAIGKWQTMDRYLNELQTAIQNGVINPTDVRTMFEKSSLPNSKFTQSAFLKNTALLGSRYMRDYEMGLAWKDALNRKDFDVLDTPFVSSPEYRNVMENARLREESMMNGSPSRSLPNFMSHGLPDYLSLPYLKQQQGAGGNAAARAGLTQNALDEAMRKKGLK